ncbi:epididymal-specific lipocalin-8 isoform 2-T2 [Glossophaga mutica]
MAPKRLEALFLTWSEAELTVKAAYSSLGSCETENIVGSEVDVSGKFAFPGHREIRVIDTDYERYAILRLSLAWHGEDIHVLKYFTRSLEDDYEPGLWKFRELTADTGLYLLARQGQCAKLLKQFSGLWYEIAFASKPQSLTPELRKMGTVLVELEGGHLALTTAYDEREGGVGGRHGLQDLRHPGRRAAPGREEPQGHETLQPEPGPQPGSLEAAAGGGRGARVHPVAGAPAQLGIDLREGSAAGQCAKLLKQELI